jgi:predicted nucleic acid-binding protein
MTPIVLDSNILLRLAEPRHSFHNQVRGAIQSLNASGHRVVLLPQIVYEFWAVATRTVQANGLGLTAANADQLIESFIRRISVMRDERGVLERWRELCRRYKVTGVKSHDTRIVAAMMRHGIRKLLTTNASDFTRYSEVDVITPDSIPAVT